MSAYEITDRDGDVVRVEESTRVDDTHAFLVASEAGVYVTAEDLRALAEAVEELTGFVSKDRLQPRVEDLLEGKSDDAPDEERKEPPAEGDVVRDLTHTLPLIEAAKGLVRQAVPGASLVLLDLGSGS